MNWIEAIILGLIQGLTEFLPVSSSGHLEIGKVLFGIDASENFYFSLAVHGATVASTLVVFRKEILCLLKGVLAFRMNEETTYVLKIIVSMIPAGLAGFLLRDEIVGLFNGKMNIVGSMLLVTAFLLTAGHFSSNRAKPIGWLDAVIIGISQAFALIPGISRSGATIATGMMIGNRRDELAKFSFLMVLVPVIGANLLELFTGDVTDTGTGTELLLAGSIAAFISGYLACRWMISLVRKSKLIWFAIYCAAAGLLTILFG
jgi:undecaprenyl-diphosphatase